MTRFQNEFITASDSEPMCPRRAPPESAAVFAQTFYSGAQTGDGHKNWKPLVRIGAKADPHLWLPWNQQGSVLEHVPTRPTQSVHPAGSRDPITALCLAPCPIKLVFARWSPLLCSQDLLLVGMYRVLYSVLLQSANRCFCGLPIPPL